ncbi:MAG: hypothetical protein JWN70_6589 [Planctomycetaceae bacterium]|nr:hypothetical protein [Planctomycetaceae bacterium]
MILMLEDEAERLERFSAVLGELAPRLPLKTWRNAHAMIREAGPFLASATMISLDHDLEPEEGCSDPGDGYLVAQWLTSQPIVRPIIIHSSNTERALWMAGEFELAGWKHWRVGPLGDDWVEVDWRHAVRRILKRVIGSELK